ncbi:PaaI family thioesterase [Archaeoglobales archaeon]|nr:MAG: PaaI family thioesterase [Archaeoglobales archaeon]
MNLKEFEEKVRNSGWYRLIGANPIVEEGKGVVEIEIDEKHKQAYKTAHGGVIASILDSAAGLSVNSLLIKQNKAAVTAEFNVSYLKPISGGKLKAEGKVINLGSKLAVAYSEVRDEKNELVAVATATFYILNLEDVLNRG